MIGTITLPIDNPKNADKMIQVLYGDRTSALIGLYAQLMCGARLVTRSGTPLDVDTMDRVGAAIASEIDSRIPNR